MKRKKAKKIHVISLDLPVDVINTIEKIAKHCGMSISNVASVLITLRLIQEGEL